MFCQNAEIDVKIGCGNFALNKDGGREGDNPPNRDWNNLELLINNLNSALTLIHNCQMLNLFHFKRKRRWKCGIRQKTSFFVFDFS